MNASWTDPQTAVHDSLGGAPRGTHAKSVPRRNGRVRTRRGRTGACSGPLFWAAVLGRGSATERAAVPPGNVIAMNASWTDPQTAVPDGLGDAPRGTPAKSVLRGNGRVRTRRGRRARRQWWPAGGEGRSERIVRPVSRDEMADRDQAAGHQAARDRYQPVRGVRRQTIEDPLAASLGGHDAGFAQDSQVVRDGGLTDIAWRHHPRQQAGRLVGGIDPPDHPAGPAHRTACPGHRTAGPRRRLVLRRNRLLLRTARPGASGRRPPDHGGPRHRSSRRSTGPHR